MKPILFNIGPVNIYAYGLFVAAGFFFAVFLARKSAFKFDIDPDIITNLGLISLIAGIAGARIGYVLTHFSEFSQNLPDIIKIYKGGLVFTSGFVLAIIVSYAYLKIKKISFLKIADFLCAYIALAQSFGRIGCFLNGCCYGLPTDSFLGLKFPHLSSKVYPTQIFASLFLIALFAFLNFIKEKEIFKNKVFLFYIFFYSLFRFFLDFIRADAIKLYGFLSLFQIITAVLVAGSAILLIKKIKKKDIFYGRKN